MKVFWSYLILFFPFTVQSQSIESKYKNVFQEILDISSISNSKLELITELDNDLAEADYNPVGVSHITIGLKKMHQYPINVFAGVACHEIGHILLKHQNKHSFSQENQADSVCGFYMRKLGFSIDEMSAVLQYYEGASVKIYGQLSDRISAYRKGWAKADKQAALINYSAFTPKIMWTFNSLDTLTVWIGERKILLDTFYNHGIIYDTLTNSTIQLLNYEFGLRETGLGRIVTNRYLYTYIRPKSGGWILYYKAKELQYDECDDHFNTVLGNDWIVGPCVNEELGYREKYRLLDATISPPNYVLPAEIYIKN